MIPSRLLLAPLVALAAMLALPMAAPAASYPFVKSLSPKRLAVGDVMTISGKYFRTGKGRTTVVFKRDGGRAIFVKSSSGTTTKLTVTVPGKLQPFLLTRKGKPVATRFRVRVLTSRFGKRFTALKDSPVITPAGSPTGSPVDPGSPAADCDGDRVPNGTDDDDDNDLLSDAQEAALKTEPCKADTDGDGVEDFFEYESALDLNIRARPYPGKRPYANPLDGADGGLDFDQDGLTLHEEYQAWVYTGRPPVLSYSDGTRWTGGRGLPPDDYKDVDADGLTNYDETHGRMQQGWWVATYDGTNDVLEAKYPGPDYLEPSFIDPDTDGDNVLDGADDQDHDGYTNAFEINRPADWRTTYVSTGHAGLPTPNPLARVQPFNPCKPIYSDACHAHPPFAYYDTTEDWASPYTSETAPPQP